MSLPCGVARWWHFSVLSDTVPVDEMLPRGGCSFGIVEHPAPVAGPELTILGTKIPGSEAEEESAVLLNP